MKVHNFIISYSNKLYILLSAFAVFMGGSIYIFLRSSEPVFFNWIKSAGLNNWVTTLRHNSFYIRDSFPDWVVYSLPDGLWAFAYSLLITSIWRKSSSWMKYFWLATIPVLVLGFEFLLYYGLIQGTFCIKDIAFELGGIIIGFFSEIKINNLKNYEKKFY